MYEPIFKRNGDYPRAFFLAGSAGEGTGHCLSAVYVAYLTPDDELIDAYPIALVPGTDVEALIAADVATKPPGCQVLVGIPAELLHVAITGRRLDDAPEDARPWLGWAARQTLADNIDLPDCAAAYAATVRFGDFIRPWYGTVALDETGRLILDDPRYDEVLDIPLLTEYDFARSKDGRLLERG